MKVLEIRNRTRSWRYFFVLVFLLGLRVFIMELGPFIHRREDCLALQDAYRVVCKEMRSMCLFFFPL